MDLYRAFCPTAAYTFFASTRGTHFRIDHMLGHKSSVNFYKIESIQSIFSNHNGMKLEIINRGKLEIAQGKLENICR